MQRLFFCLLACMLFVVQPVSAAYDVTQAGRYPQLVDSETMVSQATAQVENALTDFKETRRHTIEVVKAPRPLPAPSGELTYDVSIPNGLRYGGVTSVYVIVKADGIPFRQVICYFKIHVYDQVVVAAKNLLPERTLGAADVRMEEREIGSLSAKYLTSSDAAAGHVVNRLVREGTMLTQSMLQNPVIMEAGIPISIVATINGVKIKTEGITLQRGRADDIIRVRNTRSAKVLRAKVLDAATVEVVQ